MGLARANKGVIKYLQTIKADFMVYDDDQKKVADFKGCYSESLDGIDCIISSPGFPPDHSLIKKAKARKLPILDELEFTYQEIDGKVIAVTGTNGKSTTAALIASIMDKTKRIFLGGNISPGRPYSEALLEPPYDYYVLEVSSFQLERIEQFHPFVGVITNISADHLDRHKTLENYIASKFRIFANHQPGDHAVLNMDDEITVDNLQEIPSTKHYFSLHQETDAFVKGGKIYVNGEEVISTDEIPIPGRHNQANILAASLVASILGVKPDQIREGVKSFTGLPFRMNRIREKENIVFINNSMCTNPKAAVASLEAVENPFVVILGGSDKGVCDDEYPRYVARHSRFTVVIGANKERIADIFHQVGFKDYKFAHSMKEAVKIAFDAARPSWWVILNPGYASFDMFKDFADRGRRFNDAVATI